MKKILVLSLLLLLVATPLFAASPSTVKPFQYTNVEGNLGGYSFYGPCGSFTLDTAATDILVSNYETYPTDAPYFPAAAQEFYISSSSASDDGSVEVEYLDANWDKQTVTLDLNGQNEVNSVVLAIRVNKARIVYGGTPEENDGIIYVYWAADNTAGVPDHPINVAFQIDAGEGHSSNAYFSVPRGYIGILTTFRLGTISDSSMTFKIWKHDPTNSYTHLEKIAMIPKYQYLHGDGCATLFEEKTDIYMTVRVASGTLTFQGGFNAYTRPE